jgi:hypothetical protein
MPVSQVDRSVIAADCAKPVPVKWRMGYRMTNQTVKLSDLILFALAVGPLRGLPQTLQIELLLK